MGDNTSSVLRLARQYHNLSQAELSRRLGINKSYISELESGKRPVSLQTLRRYAAVLGIPTSSLMFFMEQVEQGAEEFVPSQGFIQGKTLQMLEWIREHAVAKDDDASQ